MSIFKQQHKKKIPSKLIKAFDAGEFIESETYCKPANKKAYAFWVLGLQTFEDLKEDDVKAALGGMVELMAKLICLSACTDAGELIFNLEEDLHELTELEDPSQFETLFMSACQANGIESLGESMNSAFSDITAVFDGMNVAFDEAKTNGAAKAPAKKRKGKKS